jgi:39S mitochondrial ribosomal protein L46
MFSTKSCSSLLHRSPFVLRNSKEIIRCASSGSSKSEGPTYFERKQAQKDQRVKLYQAKLQRAIALKDRRSEAPKDVLKQEFQEWWQAKIAREQKWDRLARKQGKDWKIQVAVVLERLPQILPDKDDCEKDFEELRAYLMQFGKDYPKEFSASLPKNGSAPVSDEELLGKI